VRPICSLTSAGRPSAARSNASMDRSKSKVEEMSGLRSTFAGADEVQRSFVHIGIAEDGLDPQFLADRAANVEGHRLDGNAHKHDRARGAGEADRALNRLRCAACVKHDVATPAAGLALHLIEEVALGDVDRDNSRMAAGDAELRLMHITQQNFAAAPTSAARATMMPIGPAPSTTATSPGLMRARVVARVPTAKGSTIAPSWNVTLSGSLKVKAAGWTTEPVSQPWIGGVAQKGHLGIDIVDAEPRRLGAEVGNARLHADPIASGSERTLAPISVTVPDAS
jgi:hypothetical protein